MDTQANEISVNNVTYVRKDSICSEEIGDKRIIVADRGWVFVGDCKDNEDGSVTIYNAQNIRRWGTTKGLGELTHGALANTQHDSYGTVKCNPIITINVESGW